MPSVKCLCLFSQNCIMFVPVSLLITHTLNNVFCSLQRPKTSAHVKYEENPIKNTQGIERKRSLTNRQTDIRTNRRADKCTYNR